MNKTSLIQSAIIIAAGAIFFLAASVGWGAGKDAAISGAVVKNAKQQAVGFQYFKSDQDRYPSEFEYANPDLMGVYFNVFPPANIFTESCPESFAYRSADSRTFQLDFCLPRALGGYREGWNSITSPGQ